MARVLRRDVLPAARWASAAGRCDSCRPQRWEIAAAMWLAPTGAAGGRTWYLARALQRVAHVPWRVAGHQVAVVPGTRLHARTSDEALRDRTRAWTHGQGACFATNDGALCRGRGTGTLASLNHPNIGGIYGLEEVHGATALVLEVVVV